MFLDNHISTVVEILLRSKKNKDKRHRIRVSRSGIASITLNDILRSPRARADIKYLAQKQLARSLTG